MSKTLEEMVDEFFELQGKNTYQVREGKVVPQTADENERQFLITALTQSQQVGIGEAVVELLKKKSVDELKETMGKAYDGSLSVQVAYKEGYNQALTDAIQKMDELFGVSKK